MAQVLIPELGLTNRNRFMPTGLPLAGGVYPELVISTAPTGSKLKNEVISAKPSPTSLEPNPERYYEVTFDRSGIYWFTQLGGEFSVQVEVAAKFTRKLAAASATIYVGNGVVVGTPTITAESNDGIATRAVTASGVRSALTALVGMDPATLRATGWPALETAFASACASPPSLQGESSATGALLAGGWERAWL